MNEKAEYFASGTIGHCTGRGVVTTGFFTHTTTVTKGATLDEVVRNVIQWVAEQNKCDYQDVHVQQFNRVSML